MMRLLLAAAATLAAVAFAAPAFAQDAIASPDVTPTPLAKSKAKPGTAAYCNTLKSASSKASCQKRVHAQAATPKAPSGSTTHKKAKKADPAKVDTSAEITPPSLPPITSSPSTVAVPPLPQKTI